MTLEQGVHASCQADHRHHCPNAAGAQHLQVQMPQTVYKRRIETQRHKQCGETHPRRDNTERQAEPAEHIPSGVRPDLDIQQVQCNQKQDDHKERDHHGDPGAGAPPLLSCLPHKRRQHSGDQTDKHTHRRVRIFLQEKCQQIGDPQKSHGCADDHRQKLWHMSAKTFKGTGQQFHHRPVDPKNHTEHTAGDPGKHRSQADQRSLEEADQEESSWLTICF